MKAVETTATVDEAQRLVLDEPLPAAGARRVRVIVLLPEDEAGEAIEADETSEQSWLRAAALNPGFDFLKAPQEDLYTIEDGKPFHDQPHDQR